MMRLSFLFLLLCVSTCVLGQDMTITIVDAETNAPIPEVFVYNQQQTIQEISDNKGQIVVEGLKNADVLLFQHAAYTLLYDTLVNIAARQFKVELQPTNIVLPEMMVTANRVREKRFEITNKVNSIAAEQIIQNNTGTAADLLSKAGNVFVQKSQSGGGSPVIRGLEANKILIVLDGVRMNNAIYRGGHVQNVITIDPMMLEKIEVVYGPGSVIYGSDALGGVMHFQTKKPQLANTDTSRLKSNLYTRFSSANKGTSVHLDFHSSFKKFASLTSLTYSKFGDSRIGQNRSGKYPNWGLMPEYIDQIEGQDSILQNDEPYVLRPTGYNQTDLLQKFRLKINQHQDLLLNLQYSKTSNIPRFDRLNDYSDGQLKFAEWHYGPQERLLLSLEFVDTKQRKMHESITYTAAFQQIEESRIKRKYQSSTRSTQIESVDVWSFNADAVKSFSPKHRLQYGAEFTLNNVQSTAFDEDIENPTETEAIPTRYPDGENYTTSYAGYLRHKWYWQPQWIWSNGVRYTHQTLQAAYQENSDYDLPYTSINGLYNAVTFSSGLIFRPKETSKISASISSGFRSPNLDDVAKFFDPSDAIVVVPNANVKPEYAYSGEVDIARQIGKNIHYNVNVFGSYLVDLIRRERFQINGQDSIVFEGTLSEVYANTNAAKAFIYGAAFSLDIEVVKGLVLTKNITYTKGRDLSNDAPLGHIPPIFGNLKLQYHFPKNLEVFSEVQYNGWKRIDEYSPNTEDKADEATVDGTPAWAIWNAGLYYAFKSRLYFTLNVDNILDTHYRPFASGVSGLGRNFVVGLRYSL